MLLLLFRYVDAIVAIYNSQVAAGDSGTELDQAIRFSELLEYIKQREQMTMLTRQVDKDKLVKPIQKLKRCLSVKK